MARSTTLAFALLAPALVGASPIRQEATTPARPNIIVILADDLGPGDVSPTNAECKIATPHLAGLAADGLTFTDAHSPSAVCTPTRYALLTGRYSWRSSLAKGVLNGYSEPLIPEERETVARMLGRAGYRTQMIGKWHLGWTWGRDGEGEVDYGAPVTGGPDAAGFDGYHALPASLDMPPYVWVDDGRVTAEPDRVEGVTRAEDRYGWYREGPIAPDFAIEDALPHFFDEADAFVREAAAGDAPFFLYLALPAPHTPIVPKPPFKGASELNPYADFVMQVDHHVGELLGALEEAGAAEDTLVIFTSDNGCSPQANFPLLREAGHDPCAGFRGHKADLYEGGHRVPLVVRWPGRVGAGTRTDALASLTDMYATFAEITGQAPPAHGAEDSASWLPLFDGGASGARTSLICHSISGHFAYREGPWKLMVARGSGGWSAPTEAAAAKQDLPHVQLYHLERDPSESTNLAAEEPERVRSMLAELEAETERGRSTPGPESPNDREVSVRPDGFTLDGDGR